MLQPLFKFHILITKSLQLFIMSHSYWWSTILPWTCNSFWTLFIPTIQINRLTLLGHVQIYSGRWTVCHYDKSFAGDHVHEIIGKKITAMLQMSKYVVAAGVSSTGSSVSWGALGVEEWGHVQKLIQFSRMELRFSGCGKTLKENCLLDNSLLTVFLIWHRSCDESGLIFWSGYQPFPHSVAKHVSSWTMIILCCK